MLFFRVLGPLIVEVGGEVLALGGGLQRRLVAALLAGEGRSVEDTLLTELVWGSDGLPSDPNALRVVVSRARAGLGIEGRDILRRTSAGYALDVPVARTDHGRFAELVGEGVRSVSVGDAVGAVRAFEAGLDLWRGEPWVELSDSVIVAGSASRLRELSEVAVEELAAARLVLGHTGEAVAALREAAMAAPFRERRWELLALGLYRAGRQEQALAELRRVRSMLGRELGVEPGPALRLMEQRVLAQDPALSWVAPGAVAVPVRRDARKSELAPPLSSFIGRDSELAMLAETLADRRLVSVVGPAGVGKTRLALEHVTGRPDAGEIWLARLAEAGDGDAVVALVAQAVGVQLHSGERLGEIGRALTGRRGILILDNCEHVVDAAAEVALALLTACPELRILTTSRRGLQAEGEQLFALDPLAVTDLDGAPADAIRLLLDRVATAHHDWVPDEAERAAAEQICRMLDGLPLAIELAAARERALGLTNLAGCLRDGLHLLGGTPRGSLTPHASLSDAIGWSVDQLAPDERELLLRLWPFEGGFGWQAAGAVAHGPAGHAVLAGLATLVECSMIQAELDNGRTRYRMLETVREYCRSIDPDAAATRDRHAAWARDFVVTTTALLPESQGPNAIGELTLELPNIRSALAHDLAHNPAEALRTVGHLDWVWPLLGLIPEGTRLLDAALRAAPSAPVEHRASALLSLSRCAAHSGERARSRRLARSVVDMLGEPRTPEHAALVVRALHCQSLAARLGGDIAELRAVSVALEQAVQQHVVPDWLRDSALHTTAILHVAEGRFEDGAEMLRVARAGAQARGDRTSQGICDRFLGLSLLAYAANDPVRGREALTALNRAASAFKQLLNRSDTLAVLYAAAYALAAAGSPADGVRLRAAVVTQARRVGVDPRRDDHLAGFELIEHELEVADRAELERAGRSMSWPETITFFDAVVTALTVQSDDLVELVD